MGTKLVLPDGRVFRYALAGATALAVGKLNQMAAPVANHLNKACDVARAIGATEISATLGATAAAANLYAEGFVHVNDATAEGHTYKIKEHAAAALSTVLTVTLADGVTVQVALVAATSEVTFTRNPYAGIIVCPTTLTAAVAGVNPVAVTAAYYFWLQTWGPAAVLANGTLVVGKMCANPATTAGSVDTYPITLTEGAPNTYTPGDSPVVGEVMQVNASTEYALVFLKIAP